MNSAYLFKSKGTRKSIESLLKLVGAPEALIEFNEHIYLAGQRISMGDFEEKYLQLEGGQYTQEFPIFTSSTYTIQGVTFSAVTTESVSVDAPVF